MNRSSKILPAPILFGLCALLALATFTPQTALAQEPPPRPSYPDNPQVPRPYPPSLDESSTPANGGGSNDNGGGQSYVPQPGAAGTVYNGGYAYQQPNTNAYAGSGYYAPQTYYQHPYYRQPAYNNGYRQQHGGYAGQYQQPYAAQRYYYQQPYNNGYGAYKGGGYGARGYNHGANSGYRAYQPQYQQRYYQPQYQQRYYQPQYQQRYYQQQYYRQPGYGYRHRR